jgi:N-acetylmuramoyl-L-alanine amidase
MIAESILCLALNLYHEARGEGPEGMMAVAQVTMNRVHHPDWPDTICEVVKQPAQFSWVADNPPKPKERAAWTTAKLIAVEMLLGEADPVLDHRALFYHASSVSPKWQDHLDPLGQIGNHHFYGYPETAKRPDITRLRPRPRPEFTSPRPRPRPETLP